MDNERAENLTHVKSASDIRNEAFLSDSFGVDHKVAKQRVKVTCLDLTREVRQKLVTGWITSGKCLWVHFGVPCGTASKARFKRLSKKKHHGPPPSRGPRWPDGLPGVFGHG